MTPIPIVILLTSTVALGIYLGTRYLRHLPRPPVLIGLHFLFGAACLEPIAIVLHGGIVGAQTKPPLTGLLTAAFIAMALASGVTAVMIGRRSRQTANVALSIHAGLAASAFTLMVAWVLKL
jgi:hypothetical protein